MLCTTGTIKVILTVPLQNQMLFLFILKENKTFPWDKIACKNIFFKENKYYSSSVCVYIYINIYFEYLHDIFN